MRMRTIAGCAALLVAVSLAAPASAQSSRFNELANLPLTGGFLSKDAIATLKNELVFQRATPIRATSKRSIESKGRGFSA